MGNETPATRKLLVVEDNPTVSRSVEAMARQLNFQTETVTDGWDAIQLLELHDDYDAILVNVDLPQRSGYGVLTFLRQERGDLGNLILMTAGDAGRVREKVQDSRCHVVSTGGTDLELALRGCSEK